MKNTKLPAYLLALTVLVLAGCTKPETTPEPAELSPKTTESQVELVPDLQIIDEVIEEILEEAEEESAEVEITTPEVEATTQTLSAVEPEPVVKPDPVVEEPVYVAPDPEPVYTEPVVEESTYEEPSKPAARRSRAS